MAAVDPVAGEDAALRAEDERLSHAVELKQAAMTVAAALSEDDVLRDEDLAQIRVPTAVIWAENDGLFNLAAGRAMDLLHATEPGGVDTYKALIDWGITPTLRFRALGRS